MSSILKRLREVSEMRELKLTDRADYRRTKWIASDDRRARAFFRVEGPRTSSTPEEREKIEEARKRSKLAVEHLHRGSRLKSFVKAMRVFFTGKE